MDRPPRLESLGIGSQALPDAGERALTDRLARFVGTEAYVEAGGAILRDLFDAQDEGYLSDRALLERLAAAKMAEAVTANAARTVRPVSPPPAAPLRRRSPGGSAVVMPWTSPG